MVSLITEINDGVQFLKEEKTPGGAKNYFIKGVFLQGGIENRNGRIYPPNILGAEVNRYVENYVSKGRALGELGHPSEASINLERCSHLIVELTKSGNDYIGKAKILGTPYGQIVKTLLMMV